MKFACAVFAIGWASANCQESAAAEKELVKLVQNAWDCYSQTAQLLKREDVTEIDMEDTTKKFEKDIYDELIASKNEKLAELYKSVCEIDRQRKRIAAYMMIDRGDERILDFEKAQGELTTMILRKHDKTLAEKFSAPAAREVERNIVFAILRLANAEPMFRSGGGLGAYYWVADVRSLYCGKVPFATINFRYLADEKVALADASPIKDGTTFDWDSDGNNDWTVDASSIKDEKAEPYLGYWFCAIELDETGKAYKAVAGGANTGKYGFCAYPAEYGRGARKTFIVNESGVVWEKDKGGKAVKQFAEGGGWHTAGLNISSERIPFWLVISPPSVVKNAAARKIRQIVEMEERADEDPKMRKDPECIAHVRRLVVDVRFMVRRVCETQQLDEGQMLAALLKQTVPEEYFNNIHEYFERW